MFIKINLNLVFYVDKRINMHDYYSVCILPKLSYL